METKDYMRVIYMQFFIICVLIISVTWPDIECSFDWPDIGIAEVGE